MEGVVGPWGKWHPGAGLLSRDLVFSNVVVIRCIKRGVVVDGEVDDGVVVVAAGFPCNLCSRRSACVHVDVVWRRRTICKKKR